MKRSLTTLVSLLTLATLPASAQKQDNSYHGGLTLYGGLTSFTADFTPAQSYTVGNASGLAAGLGVISHVGGPVGLEVDAGYVQAGFSGASSGVTATVHDNNIGGAFLLRPAFGSGPVRVFAEGGISAAYLVNCSETLSSGTATTCKVDASQNRMDYGIALGGGVSYGILAAQLRYDIGVANLTKTSGATVKSKGLLILGSVIL